MFEKKSATRFVFFYFPGSEVKDPFSTIRGRFLRSLSLRGMDTGVEVREREG